MSLANKAQLQKRKRVLSKKNSSHQVSHLFSFPSHNESIFFISNISLHNNTEQKPSNEGPNVDQTNSRQINLEDIKVESRVFPVLTKTNGLPRLIQEVKINLGSKYVLTMTNMDTNLTLSALSDEYVSQIVSTLSPPNVINEYRLEDEENTVKTEERCPLGDRTDGLMGLKKEGAMMEDKPEIEEKLSETFGKKEEEEGGNRKNLFSVKKKIQKQKALT